MPDRYKILDEIGRGGMGVVHRARDRKLGREVALKRLREEHLLEEKLKKRFRREVRAVAQLDHPHIVPVYDFGVEDGVPFLVMPYVEGPTLRERVSEEDSLSAEETVRIGRKIASALSAAHEEGFVHRDVKSQNVLIDGVRPRLTDFGIARLREKSELTSTGKILGTPAYMSPEQLDGKEVGPPSDIYSLGLVLYECLSGRLPYEGENTMQVLYAVASGEPEPLEEVAPGVPLWLVQVVERCLSEEPRERYESAGALKQALKGEDPVDASEPLTIEMSSPEKLERPPMPSESEMEAWPEQLAPLREALRHSDATIELDLSSSSGEGGLTELPSAIGRLTQLEDLSLWRNDLMKLPVSIGQLTRLEKLWLGGNDLTDLPASMCRLTQLKQLTLKNNELTELPEWVGQLTLLEKLWLGGNDLTELPQSIGRLTQLRYLNLIDSDLKELPNTIGRLTNLEKLHLTYNDLKELPDAIGRLTSLEKLYLRHNDLTEVPDSAGSLSNLERLDLRSNRLPPGTVERLRRQLRDAEIKF